MAVDKGQFTHLLMLDLSAASDTVNHEVMLTRFNQSFGLCGIALNWFCLYLQDRTQVVSPGGVLSNISSLACGVL